MDMRTLKAQLYAAANEFDNIPVIGKTARVKLTAAVDYLVSVTNSIVIEPPQEMNPSDAEKDVVSDEHDFAEP